MKNLLTRRTLILLTVAILAILGLVISLLFEKKQLIDIYESENEPDSLEFETEPVKPRKVGRPPKSVTVVNPEPTDETINPAIEKPANEVENEVS